MPLILISGSNGSGKSLFAEEFISQTEGKRIYIATMKPQTADNFSRIEKHRKQREHLCIEKHRRQREHLHFDTLELPYAVASAAVDGDSVVLLEDVSNLFANAYFEKNGTVDSVLADILQLKSRCKTLVAVTISGLQNEGYDEETAAYINGLNNLNQHLFDLSDLAFTMEKGQPVCQKGEHHANS